MNNNLPEFGIAMNGCRQAITETILSRIDPDKQFVYAEIGIAEGRTLSAVASIIEKQSSNFICYGVDIEQGWSLNKDLLEKNIAPFGGKVVYSLCGSTEFLNTCPNHHIDFLLIDGCHERECAALDFTNAVEKIKPNGFVAFHDTADFAQGIQPQPHRGELCNVLLALQDVGLLNDQRPGWKTHWKVEGEPNGENNGMMIFKKENHG